MRKAKQLMRFIVVGIFIFANISFAQKAFEGYWEQTTTSKTPMKRTNEAEEVKNQKVFYKPGMMKIVELEEQDIIIIRLDKELSWYIDKKEVTYTEMKFSDVEEGMNQAKESMKQMQEQMKNMSPEERKMMEQMMGSKMAKMMGAGEGPQLSVKKTGEIQTVNGYKCNKVLLNSENEPLMTFWMTDKYQLGNEFMETYRKMGFFDSYIPAEMKEMKGFPIKTEMSMNTGFGNVETMTIVNKIVPQSVSTSEFELPKGLKKREMPMMPPE